MAKRNNNDLVSNRKAFHEYEILETFEAGMVLFGTEIKSLRQNQASLQESYIVIRGAEVFLIGSYIAHYAFGNVHNHEERRDRKLLLHQHEIQELKKAREVKGLTIIPLNIYLKKGYAKIKIAVARGKKAHDKRASIKEKQIKRELQQALKNR